MSFSSTNFISQSLIKCRRCGYIGNSVQTNKRLIKENQEMKTTHLSGKEHEKDERESWKGNDQNLMMKKEEEKAKWDCGSPLYDSYELVKLNHLIDRNLMEFPSLHGSIPTFSHHSHDVVMENKVDSLDKSKESFWVTSLSCFLVMMKRRKDNEERRKKNKEMRRGCVYNRFTSLWRK